MLLCERPHVKDVDFGDTARFIVSTASGLNVNGQHLVMGDEVPRGVLSVEAMRQIYEPPLRLIETVEYVREDPNLVEACNVKGTSLDLLTLEVEIPKEGPVVSEELLMCDECGVMMSIQAFATHSKKQCKRNQKNHKKGN